MPFRVKMVCWEGATDRRGPSVHPSVREGCIFGATWCFGNPERVSQLVS